MSDSAADRARIMRMCANSHLLKLNDEDLAALFPDLCQEAAIPALREITSAHVVVLIRGGDGTSTFMGDDRVDMPAEKLPPLADTVGAGDMFSAALLAGLAGNGALLPSGLTRLTHDGLYSLLQRASIAAALNCTRAGCNPPTRTELEAAGTSETAEEEFIGRIVSLGETLVEIMAAPEVLASTSR